MWSAEMPRPAQFKSVVPMPRRPRPAASRPTSTSGLVFVSERVGVALVAREDV